LGGILPFLFASIAGKNSLRKKVLRLSGYPPNDISLYELALTHTSVVKDPKHYTRLSNERLEFLGDAVLGSVVADYLYQKYPVKDEGFLTEMRSKMVNRNTLNDIAWKLKLNLLIEHLVVTPSASRHKSFSGDALEAFIGAFYLDQGYTKTRNFILKKILMVYFDLDELEGLNFNAKSKLIEFVRKNKLDGFSVLIEESDFENQTHKIFTVSIVLGELKIAIATEPKKRMAEQKASEAALEWLKEELSKPDHNLPLLHTV